MAYYWVNVGTSYREVKSQNILWAPSVLIDQNGRSRNRLSWGIVASVQAGDIFFCCKDNYIIYIAVAKKCALKSLTPEGRRSSKTEGNQVNIDVVELLHPLNVKDFRESFIENFQQYFSEDIFKDDLSRHRKYMISIPELAALFLLDMITDEDDSINIQSLIEFNRQKKGTSRRKTGAEKDAISKARIGQGPFRNDLLNLWKNTCPVTKINNKKLLIASHILSWKLSNSEEKVDKYNGLPLTPNADKLFDKGLISFADNGKILLKDEITPKILKQLGIDPLIKISGLKKQNKPYLKKHRKLYGFTE